MCDDDSDHSVVFPFWFNLLHQPWSTLNFFACTSSCLPVGVSVAPSSDPIWSPEEGLAFKVVWVDWDCRKSPWGAGTGYIDILLISQFHIILSAHAFCINVMDVFGPFMGLHAFGLPSTPPARWWLCAPSGGCHRESSLGLLVPAGPGGECLGASQIATSRVLVVLRIRLISSGPGTACSYTKTHT